MLYIYIYHVESRVLTQIVEFILLTEISLTSIDYKASN